MMNFPHVLFYLLALLAALSAVAILITRNVFYAAFMLLVCLLAVAGIYVLAFAEFVAVTQLLIYAGGILVTIVFGIMLTSKISGKPLSVKNNKWIPGVGAGGVFLGMLVYYISKEDFLQKKPGYSYSGYNSINQIGMELMSTYFLPFEVAAILLLIALVGAAITASLKKKEI